VVCVALAPNPSASPPDAAPPLLVAAAACDRCDRFLVASAWLWMWRSFDLASFRSRLAADIRVRSVLSEGPDRELAFRLAACDVLGQNSLKPVSFRLF
jgi:hypothetical protein